MLSCYYPIIIKNIFWKFDVLTTNSKAMFYDYLGADAFGLGIKYVLANKICHFSFHRMETAVLPDFSAHVFSTCMNWVFPFSSQLLK